MIEYAETSPLALTRLDGKGFDGSSPRSDTQGNILLINAGRVEPGAVVSCDVCVIGAGAAGITCALELSRTGGSIVLLEGGGLREEPAAQDTYRGETIGPGALDLHPALDTVRQKRFGGTTGAWGGRCVPLDPIDFEPRDSPPSCGWPIGRRDLDEYYARANLYCEAGEYEYASDSALPGSAPFVLEQGQPARFTDRKLLRYSRPTDFGKAYRTRLRRSPHIRAFYHANVLRLELDSLKERITTAVVASSPGREFRVQARFFVLAAGGLETTRLLLMTRREARTSMGGVALGHYYMTHLDGYVGRLRFLGPAPRAAYSYERSHDGIYCRRLLCPTEDTLRREALLNFSAVLYMPSPEDPSHGDGLLSAFVLAKQGLHRAKIGFKAKRPDPEFASLPTGAHARNVMREPLRLVRFGPWWLRERVLASRKVPSFLTQPKNGVYRFLFSAEQSASYANSVELGASCDRFGIPRLRVNWKVSRSDYESIVRSLALIGSELERLRLANVEIPGTPEELAASIGGGFLGGTHAMGTARMSRSSEQGVVDPECRVHGVRNLYVASSAVFPTGGFGAPTLTIVALSIRVCKVIASALLSGPMSQQL